MGPALARAANAHGKLVRTAGHAGPLGHHPDHRVLGRPARQPDRRTAARPRVRQRLSRGGRRRLCEAGRHRRSLGPGVRETGPRARTSPATSATSSRSRSTSRGTGSASPPVPAPDVLRRATGSQGRALLHRRRFPHLAHRGRPGQRGAEPDPVRRPGQRTRGDRVSQLDLGRPGHRPACGCRDLRGRRLLFRSLPRSAGGHRHRVRDQPPSGILRHRQGGPPSERRRRRPAGFPGGTARAVTTTPTSTPPWRIPGSRSGETMGSSCSPSKW